MNTPNTPYGSNEQEQALQTQNNNIENNNQTNTSKSKKKFLIAGAATIATLLGGGTYYLTSQKKEAPKADKIEITAPENKVPEQYNLKTAKFQNNTERKEKSIEKKPTQDEIDAQEAKERGIDVKWRVKQKTDLQEARKFLTKRAKKDFEDENYREILRNIKEQYDDLKLKTPKDIQELFNELLEREAENPKAIFGEYAE